MAGDPQFIVNLARKLIGSHYLWGSGGSTPDSGNGVFYRRAAVTLAPSSLDPNAPCVFAAECSVAGHFVCAGRFNNLPGGRYAHPGDWDLNHYLTHLQSLPSPTFWDPFCSNFTPRIVRGSNVSNDGKLVWGEDCRFQRHFDCISFINYVASRATDMELQLDIKDWPTRSFVTTIDRDAAIVPGDILLRDHDHIGFLTETGMVIQAQDHATGVHEVEKYHSHAWTGRLRIDPKHILTS